MYNKHSNSDSLFAKSVRLHYNLSMRMKSAIYIYNHEYDAQPNERLYVSAPVLPGDCTATPYWPDYIHVLVVTWVNQSEASVAFKFCTGPAVPSLVPETAHGEPKMLPTSICLLLLCLAAAAQPPPAPTTVAMVIGGFANGGDFTDSVELFGCDLSGGQNPELVTPYPMRVYLSGATHVPVRAPNGPNRIYSNLLLKKTPAHCGP